MSEIQGGPPPSPSIKPTKASAETAPKSQEFSIRRNKVLGALSNERLKQFKGDETRVQQEDWVEGLKEHFDPATEFAIETGKDEAIVTQYADGSTDLGTAQGKFTAVYLNGFEAHANIAGRRLNVTPADISDIVQDPNIQKVPDTESGFPAATEGTVLIVDKEGNPTSLIVETAIEGVRIWMDGSAVTRAQEGGTIRPMLFIKIDPETAKMAMEAKSKAAGSPRGPDFKPRQKFEGESTDEDRVLTPGEMLAEAKLTVKAENDRYTELHNSGTATEGELHAQENRVRDAREGQREIDHEIEREQDRKMYAEGLQETKDSFAKQLAEFRLEYEKQTGELINQLAASNKRGDELTDLMAETIKASNMDEEKKKNLLAELAKIAATFVAGTAISGVKETTSG